MCRATRPPVFYWTSFLNGFLRKHNEKAWALIKCFSAALAANFKMATMTQLAKLFLRKRGATEKGLHSLQTMNNEMSKRRFTEELSFETEVAQAAALSAILLSKKQRQARGLDELRINNWWSQGYRN